MTKTEFDLEVGKLVRIQGYGYALYEEWKVWKMEEECITKIYLEDGFAHVLCGGKFLKQTLGWYEREYGMIAYLSKCLGHE